MPVLESKQMTVDEWRAEATRLFGPDEMKWRWRCPVCKHECSTLDYKDAGAPESAVGFSCVGRWLPERRLAFEEAGTGPCNYAGGGLFQLNPLVVLDQDGGEHRMFEFGQPA